MSEAVVFMSHHRNEYYSKSKANGNSRVRSFGSPPFRDGFQDFNFRYIDSSNGILPTPIEFFPANVTESSFSPKTPSLFVNEPKNSKKFSKNSSFPTPVKVISSHVTKQSFSPKTSSPSAGELNKHTKKFTHSRSTPIPIKINADLSEMFFSERWAGPTYSNSPPASSLPMPKFSKFSSRPHRTASLDLPSSSAPNFKFVSLAKSAPVSPSRDCISPFSGEFRNSDASATKILRRILKLDSEDE